MPTAPFVSLERDESVVEGRAKRAAETYYIVPGMAVVFLGTASHAASTDYYGPIIVRTPIIVDLLAFENTGVGGNTRIGLYRADRNWQPLGAPIVDSGSISVAATGVKTYTPGTPILLRPGRYLSVHNQDNNTTYRAYRGGVVSPISDTMGTNTFVTIWRVTRAYAAFPTPGTAWDTVTGSSSGFGDATVLLRESAP